ncbi:ribonuclease H-like domain-containing protein [Tanacetum coccineum]
MPLKVSLFAPPIIDLSHSGIKKFREPKFEGYGVKVDKCVSETSPKEIKKTPDALIIEDWVSNDEEQDKSKPKSKKKTIIPTVKKKEFVKAKQDDKIVRNTVKYAEMYRSQKSRGNQRNWNNLKSQQLGNEFVMNNKACFACGSFNHLIKDCKRKVQKPIWDNARKVNLHNSHKMSYPHPKRNFVPKAVLMKTGMRPVNATKPKAAYNVVKLNRSIQVGSTPHEYLLKFHNVPDDKSLWAAIKASQLEVHGAPISKEDINQKFLRSLPPSWNQIALIIRNKPDIDEIDIDDLYNNLRVYEDEMKMYLSSTSTSQNLAFLFFENTSSTNEVSTASGHFGVSTAGGISQVATIPCAHDVMVGGYVDCQSEEIHSEDWKELGFQRKRPIFLDKSKIKSNAPTNESSSQALVAQDGLGGYDWSNDFEVEPVNYALMAISSSSLSTLESLESRILVHEKNELAWGEKYEFQNYELKCREIKINNLNLELEKVVKERDELKLKIEKWEESSKNLDELLNGQMSARDKTGLAYGIQLNEMSNNSDTDSEISLSVFDVKSSDRFSKADGYHAVPPSITGNFLNLRADISFVGLDENAIRKKITESKTTDLNTKSSEIVGKTNETNTQKPKTVYESVNRDKVIIEDWNSDDVFEVQTVSPFKTNETQTVKTKIDKIGQTSQKQRIGFKKIKACFVCKSTDNLIKDCTFHDRQSQEPKLKTVVNTGSRVDKQVWDNTKRVNHIFFSKYPYLRKTFVPSGVLTKTGLITPVKQNEKRAVYKVSTVRPVSTTRPVSTVRPFALKIA